LKTRSTILRISGNAGKEGGPSSRKLGAAQRRETKNKSRSNPPQVILVDILPGAPLVFVGYVQLN